MEHYNTSFFTYKTQPRAFIITFKDFSTVTIKESEDMYGASSVTFYFMDESKLIEFVNSVKSAYDSYRKEKGYDRG